MGCCICSGFWACLDKLKAGGRSAAAGADDAEDGIESFDLFFDLHALQIATSFFSDLNKLGHGGFGPVYKTDVFSYGVLVLEIVSGRKNHDGQLEREKADLLSYTWMLHQRGKVLDLVDPTLARCNPDEAAMCIQIGLLCCQASVAERPDMNSIHLMFSSDSFTLPRPGKPGLQGRGGRWTTTSTSAFTNNTNASSGYTGATKASGGSSFVEEYSRNSMSHSSMDEGFIVLFAGIWYLQEATPVHMLREVILFTGVMNSLFSVYDIYDDLISRRINTSDAERFADECPCCTGCGWGVIWAFISFTFLCGSVYLALVILSPRV
ncbi:unnamed protein product [Malus baccata var. baccata]